MYMGTNIPISRKLYFYFHPWRGDPHIGYRMQCVIMTKITWPSHPLLLRHFQFSKKYFKCPWQQKGRLHLWRTTYFTYNCWSVFCSLPLWILGGNRAKLKKLFNLNGRLGSGTQYTKCTEYTCFLISNCSNAIDFLNWR